MSVAFQRQPQSVWWYSNVVRFGGIQRRAWWAGGFEVRQQWQNATYPTHHQSHHSGALFLQSAGAGLKNCVQQGLGTPKPLTDDSKRGMKGGFDFFNEFDIQVQVSRARPPVESARGKCSRNSLNRSHYYLRLLLLQPLRQKALWIHSSFTKKRNKHFLKGLYEWLNDTINILMCKSNTSRAAKLCAWSFFSSSNVFTLGLCLDQYWFNRLTLSAVVKLLILDPL